MIDFVKRYFQTNVVFSGRPAIHVHDDLNDKLLEAHQETNQFARDTLVFGVLYMIQIKKLGTYGIRAFTYGRVL